MPAGVVKTEKDEHIWKQKVSEVEKSQGKTKKTFTDRDWGLVNMLFQKAKKKYAGKRLPKKYAAASFLDRLIVLSSDLTYPYYHVSDHPETPTIYEQSTQELVDPFGIYLFIKGEHVDVKFWTDKKYRWQARLKSENGVKTLDSITRSEAETLLKKAGIKTSRDAFDALKHGVDEDEFEFEYYQDILGEIDAGDVDNPTDSELEKSWKKYFTPAYASQAMWRIIRSKFNDRRKFTDFLLNNGWKAVRDTTGAIYAGEPQVIVLDPSVIEWGSREKN